MTSDKVRWQGKVVSVQPRIRLTRSFDQRFHTYLGYGLHIQGQIDGQEAEFWVGIGEAAQTKHQFKVDDLVTGQSVSVPDPNLEPVDYYKTSGLAVTQRALLAEVSPPPWQGVPPALEVYRARGHRRLSAQTYATKCTSCIWGCRMAVEMIIDQWKPWQRRYRSETFCYGPKSCPIYKAGPTRKVPGRRGMVWEEEDWVDAEATAHRALDE